MIEERNGYFLLAYDAPSFSAAAAKVPMTPQGFAKAIRNLERDLGVPLFTTDENGHKQPTAYADEYYRYAKHLQSAREKLETSFERIANDDKADLNVACAMGVPGLLGPEAMQWPATQHPRVNIALSELPDLLCEALIAKGVFDVGIVLWPVEESLSHQELMQGQVMLWVNVDDPLSKQEYLTYEDLSNRKIAMPGKGFKCYGNFRASCLEHGIEMPEIIERAEIFWIYHFVMSGRGLGFCLPHLATLDIFTDLEHIKALPLQGAEWRVCFAWPKTRCLTELEQEYLAHLSTHAEAVESGFLPIV